MKYLAKALAVSLFMIGSAMAEDQIETLTDGNTLLNMKPTGGYGAPFVGVSSLDGSGALVLGGRAGVMLDRHFVFGGTGTAVIGKHQSEAEKDRLILGYGGVFVEFVPNFKKTAHLSFPISLQVGGVQDDSGGFENVTVFVIDPAVSLEMNYSHNLLVSANLGYRLVNGKYSEELSGVYASAVFKFGSF